MALRMTPVGAIAGCYAAVAIVAVVGAFAVAATFSDALQQRADRLPATTWAWVLALTAGSAALAAAGC